MKSKKDVAMKRAAGFTEAKISGRWRPIASVQIRVPSSASTRRREMGAASRKSQVLSKRPASKKPASRKPACLNPFKMAVTDAWCICMVADVRRGSARTEMNHMRVRTRTFVQGVDGKGDIAKVASSQGDQQTLQLSAAGAARSGVPSAIIKCKTAQRAPGVWGCSMSHKYVLQAISKNPGPSPYCFVFEDDFYHAMCPEDIEELLDRLVTKCWELPDVIYLGFTALEAGSRVYARSGAACIVETSQTYGSFAYAIRPCACASVLRFLDPNKTAVVYASDGALRRATTLKLITAAHISVEGRPFQCFPHRPSSDSGGSRISCT